MKLISAFLTLALGLTSCSTSYDAYGRPTTSVSPEAAVAATAAAGIIGYQLSKNRYKDKRGRYYRTYEGRRYYDFDSRMDGAYRDRYYRMYGRYPDRGVPFRGPYGHYYLYH